MFLIELNSDKLSSILYSNKCCSAWAHKTIKDNPILRTGGLDRCLYQFWRIYCEMVSWVGLYRNIPYRSFDSAPRIRFNESRLTIIKCSLTTFVTITTERTFVSKVIFGVMRLVLGLKEISLWWFNKPQHGLIVYSKSIFSTGWYRIPFFPYDFGSEYPTTLICHCKCKSLWDTQQWPIFFIIWICNNYPATSLIFQHTFYLVKNFY